LIGRFDRGGVDCWQLRTKAKPTLKPGKTEGEKWTTKGLQSPLKTSQTVLGIGTLSRLPKPKVAKFLVAGGNGFQPGWITFAGEGKFFSCKNGKGQG